RSALGWRSVQPSGATNYMWALTWTPSELVWSLEWANSSGFRAAYLTDSQDTNHPRGAGLQGFPMMLLGQAYANIKITAAASVADSSQVDGGTGAWHLPWQVGDRVYNLQPTVGGPEGWVCIQAGRPGAWSPFGQVGAVH